MKKLISIISFALIITTLALMLVSCGGDKVKGTWKVVSLYGEELDDTLPEMLFEFDGKGNYKANGISGTYTIDGNNLYMDGVKYSISLKGKTLTLTPDSSSILDPEDTAADYSTVLVKQ